MSRHEAYGYEKLVYYGLRRIFYHICKGLSTEQDDENSQDSVCYSVSHVKYRHCRPCRILGHWEVKLVSIAAEKT